MSLLRIFFIILAAVVPGYGAAQPEALEIASRERMRAGLTALAHDPRLAIAAEVQARHMAQRRQIGHVGPGGSGVLDRVRAAGYPGCHMAENVAGGQKSLRAVMRSWMQSEGHRRNILNANMTHGAVVAARDRQGRLWWAMVLGGPC